MRGELVWAIGDNFTGEVTGEVTGVVPMGVQRLLTMTIPGKPTSRNRNTGSPQKGATSSRNWRRRRGTDEK